MKGTKQRISLAFLCVFVLSGGMGWISALTVLASMNNERPLAIVRRHKPGVLVKYSDAKSWDKAKMAAPLFSSDTLRTDETGYAVVQFMDNSIVKVKPNSLLSIRGEVRDKNNTASRIAVELGEVFLNVTKRRSDFEVQTPTAVASVKGTSYSTQVANNGSSTFKVFTGLVEVKVGSTGEPISLTAGYKVNVEKKDGEAPEVNVGQMNNDEINESQGEYDDLDAQTRPKKLKLNFRNEAGQLRQIEIDYFENNEQ